MNLVDKKVMHKSFGKGNVVNYNDSYIRISFESGERRFVYPDVFKKYVTFVDGKATKLVDKQIEKKEEVRKGEEKLKKEMLKQEKLLEQERLELAKIKKERKVSKVDSRIQSVFWLKSNEEDKVFEDWKVFTGKIKSGENKGLPRKLGRMSGNSACLLTKRDDSVKEEERQILGVFMANDSFDGKNLEDGYITADPKYRINLSDEESKKLLFWNYYMDEKSNDKIIWNSGRQRYFDNILMAQILRDIVILKENSEHEKEVQDFFNHFCKINYINKEKLPKANGALMNMN